MGRALAPLLGLLLLLPAPAAGAEFVLLGLLELPGLCADASRVDLRLHPAPDAASRPLRRITDAGALATREYEYEQPGIVVLERRPGWYRVALGRGDGWIAETPGMRFHDVASLLAGKQTYFTPAWDGRLRSAPRPDSPAFGLPRGWRTRLGDPISMEIERARKRDDRLWLEVRIPWPVPCAGEAERIVARGWLPARAADGRLNAWFFSRGC